MKPKRRMNTARSKAVFSSEAEFYAYDRETEKNWARMKHNGKLRDLLTSERSGEEEIGKEK